MKPNQGRLQTGEHILARIVESSVPGTRVVIARFEKDDEGTVDFSCRTDLRELSIEELEKETNEVISRNLPVSAITYLREEVSGEFDLSKLPKSVKEIRIVEVQGFDKRPCRDPHVSNTSEIGTFRVNKIKKAGKDRYRITFSVE